MLCLRRINSNYTRCPPINNERGAGEDGEIDQTIVANLSLVSSLLKRNLPHPSNSSARLSTFVPEKSSKQTLKMCSMRCGGTTRNLVRLERYVMFLARDEHQNVNWVRKTVQADLQPHLSELLDHILLSLQVSKLFIQLQDT
jgi:hypothetical protein